MFVSVIYVVDLRRAVYYQKCHDPDCRGEVLHKLSSLYLPNTSQRSHDRVLICCLQISSGYRSPLREVPDGAIPDPVSLCNLPRESDAQGGTSFEDDAKLTDSCTKKEWWLEAVRVAKEVEVQKALDLTQTVSIIYYSLHVMQLHILPTYFGVSPLYPCNNPRSIYVRLSRNPFLVEQDETNEEDENWWLAAVNTASETELTYLQKSQQLELCSN